MIANYQLYMKLVFLLLISGQCTSFAISHIYNNFNDSLYVSKVFGYSLLLPPKWSAVTYGNGMDELVVFRHDNRIIMHASFVKMDDYYFNRAKRIDSIDIPAAFANARIDDACALDGSDETMHLSIDNISSTSNKEGNRILMFQLSLHDTSKIKIDVHRIAFFIDYSTKQLVQGLIILVDRHLDLKTIPNELIRMIEGVKRNSH